MLIFVLCDITVVQQEFIGQPQTIVQRELTLGDDVAMHHDEALTEVILKFKLAVILPEMKVVILESYHFLWYEKTPTSRWLYRPTNETLFFKLNHAYTLPSRGTLNQYWSLKVSLQTEMTYRYHWRFESMYEVNWENDFVSMIKHSSFTTVCISNKFLSPRLTPLSHTICLIKAIILQA